LRVFNYQVYDLSVSSVFISGYKFDNLFCLFGCFGISC
jgi:hypothetical protein